MTRKGRSARVVDGVADQDEDGLVASVDRDGLQQRATPGVRRRGGGCGVAVLVGMVLGACKLLSRSLPCVPRGASHADQRVSPDPERHR